MKSKRKLIATMVIVGFILLSVIATAIIVFAATQQTIKTTLNITYKVSNLDGTVSATYKVGNEEEKNLTAVKKGGSVLGNTLIFSASDTEDAGSLEFPPEGLSLTSANDYVVIKYTYTNTGDKHYIATMSFGDDLKYENMNVEYGIKDLNTDEIKYSSSRYALVVPSDQTLSYWIKITIKEKSKTASFTGDFNWFLEGCNKDTLGYEMLPALDFKESEDGEYTATYNGDTSALQEGVLIIPNTVNGAPVTSVVANENVTPIQKSAVKSVVIPENVKTIGDSAFENFASLETITFKQNELAGSASVQTAIGLTTIGNNAFMDCVKLTSIEIPNSLTSIGSAAFMGSGLTNVTLKNTSGWSVYEDQLKTALVDDFANIDLSNTSNVAALLKNTYANYYWTCEN